MTAAFKTFEKATQINTITSIVPFSPPIPLHPITSTDFSIRPSSSTSKSHRPFSPSNPTPPAQENPPSANNSLVGTQAEEAIYDKSIRLKQLRKQETKSAASVSNKFVSPTISKKQEKKPIASIHNDVTGPKQSRKQMTKSTASISDFSMESAINRMFQDVALAADVFTQYQAARQETPVQPESTEFVVPAEPAEQWRAEDLGFLDPAIPASYGPGDMVWDGNVLYYRNVHLFVERIRYHTTMKGEKLFRTNLNTCLRGKGLEWYSSSLSALERRALQQLRIDNWYIKLTDHWRLKHSLSKKRFSINGWPYVLVNTMGGVLFFLYGRKFLLSTPWYGASVESGVPRSSMAYSGRSKSPQLICR